MPLLLARKIPPVLLSVSWLCSPLFGFVLHPCIAMLSDKYGRRPFIVGLGAVAAGGLVAIPRCARIQGYPGVVAAMLAFGVSDTCLDLLLTPTRAAMNDVFVPEAAERRTSVSSATGMLIGLLCATFLKADLAFMVVGGIVAAAAALQLVVPCRAAPQEADDVSTPGASTTASTTIPKQFWALWTLMFCGWVSMSTFTFYFTSVWSVLRGYGRPGTDGFDEGVHAATRLLIAHTVCYIISGMALPLFVRACRGEMNAVIVSVIICALQFASWFVVPPMCCVAWAIVVLPMAFQCCANVPFAWLEKQDQFDDQQRGRLTGVLNMTLAAGQITTSLATGPVVAYFDGHLLAAYLFAAILDVVFLGCVLVYLACNLRSNARSSRSTALIDPSSPDPPPGP